MKPFDLHKAMAGAPVVTASGKKVTEIKFLATASPKMCVVAVIDGMPDFFEEDGRVGRYAEADYLGMAATKKYGWINLYRGFATDGTPRSAVIVGAGEVFPDEIYADIEAKHLIPGRMFLGRVRVEWEE